MSVFCPECDTAVPLPDDLVETGVDKIRCRNCGARFRVLPGGHTLALGDAASGGTMQPGSGGQGSPASAAFGSGSDTPASPPAAGAGLDLPNLSERIGRDEQAAIRPQAWEEAEEARRRELRRILEPVDIHGWDAERVQERQRKQAEALGIPVVFRDELADGSPGPEMVLIPSGIYLMGSPPNEPERSDDEGPQQRVTIARPFAIGRYALTFAEWDAFAAATSGFSPEDADWGRGDRPVINVSWDDSQEYLRWLSSQTGQEYRLPSESEWEYACRAGTTKSFNTGDTITNEEANFRELFIAEGSLMSLVAGKTAPVGSYPSNSFGLHEMHGNVDEWVADCWNDSYLGVPTDGSAWLSGDCGRAILRGGSWDYSGQYLRSADRGRNPRGDRGYDIGFRAVRSVTL